MSRRGLEAAGRSPARTTYLGSTVGIVLLLVTTTAIAVFALAVLLGKQLERNVRTDAFEAAERTGRVFASLALHGDAVQSGRLTAHARADVDAAARADHEIAAIRVYTRSGRVAYASEGPFPGMTPSDGTMDAFSGRTTSRLTRAGGRELVEVNLPLRTPGRVGPVAVTTVYLPYSPTRSAIATQNRGTRLLLTGVGILLLLVTVPLTVRAARSLAGGRRHVGLQRELRRGLADQELTLHYQPKLEMTTGAVVGTEALVRWNHSELGLLGPERFIPQAEQAGLIGPLTMRVFDMAISQIAHWRRDGVALPPVAVNLSPVVLADAGLALELGKMLERHGVAAEDVVIEMTETSVMSDAGQGYGALVELDRMGFSLSLDDFGTGHSSLARLDQLPLTEVKIDRSFTSRMAEPGTGRLVSVMIDLVHDLGMRVVAEGVESEEVARLLMAAGCRFAQGYHYARPMPARQLEAWLAARPLVRA